MDCGIYLLCHTQQTTLGPSFYFPNAPGIHLIQSCNSASSGEQSSPLNSSNEYT